MANSSCGIAMKFYRVERFLYMKGFHRLSMVVCRTMQILFGCIVRPTTEIGSGTVFPHSVGIVIHHMSRIGTTCRIYQNVTMGGGQGPVLGDNVFVGAGACILGNVVIGNDCKIGANAVVISNLPNGATAVGVPARIVKIYGKRVSSSVYP